MRKKVIIDIEVSSISKSVENLMDIMAEALKDRELSVQKMNLFKGEDNKWWSQLMRISALLTPSDEDENDSCVEETLFKKLKLAVKKHDFLIEGWGTPFGETPWLVFKENMEFEKAACLSTFKNRHRL